MTEKSRKENIAEPTNEVVSSVDEDFSKLELDINNWIFTRGRLHLLIDP